MDGERDIAGEIAQADIVVTIHDATVSVGVRPGRIGAEARVSVVDWDDLEEGDREEGWEPGDATTSLVKTAEDAIDGRTADGSLAWVY